MKQKTLYTTNNFVVGDEVLLIGKQNENGGKETFSVSKKYAKTGYPGNVNSNIFRFHGWRGTTSGIAVYAYGVRKIEMVESTEKTDEWGDTIYKIRVGVDIRPEFE